MHRSWSSFEFDPEPHRERLWPLLELLREQPPQSDRDWRRTLKSFRKPDGGFYSKAEINAAARAWNHPFSVATKPTRTRSGVAPVTLFTQPHPCPGRCIYCPNDIRAPKAYLGDEPGVQRARSVNYDPYAQTWNRLLALFRLGHAVQKAEIVILGGTWSSYSLGYQVHFVKECLRALNDFRGTNPTPIQGVTPSTDLPEPSLVPYNVRVVASPSFDVDWGTLERELERHAHSSVKLVGLCIETRPDRVSWQEISHWRRLGITKVQIGVQSLSDKVLRLNQRDHNAEQVKDTFDRLRLAGFKIQAHWMTNLLGSDPESDRLDYHQFVSQEHPDELKLYPCQLIPGTTLYREYQAGNWRPYSQGEQLGLLSDLLALTPENIRLSRVIRDIPRHWVADGGVDTNLREAAETIASPRDLRAREIGLHSATPPFRLQEKALQGRSTEEHFLSVVDANDRVLGICRLSLPHQATPFPELTGCAMIRELHVYGPATDPGQPGEVQHRGFGEQLLRRALEIASRQGYSRTAVIAAVGTTGYYEKFGFQASGHYWVRGSPSST